MSLPLDGNAQFIVLSLSMAFSAYVAQFLNRLYKSEIKRYRTSLRIALALFMLATFVLFARIILGAVNNGLLFLDLLSISLLVLAHVVLVVVSIRSYFIGD